MYMFKVENVMATGECGRGEGGRKGVRDGEGEICMVRMIMCIPNCR